MPSGSVLIVEDDESIRESLELALALEGISVQTAKHGEDAFNFLANNDAPCVILLDLQMPVMDGAEFLRRKKALPGLAEIPTVVMSGTDEPKLRSELSPEHWIRKPPDIDEVIEVVRIFCDEAASAPWPPIPLRRMKYT